MLKSLAVAAVVLLLLPVVPPLREQAKSARP